MPANWIVWISGRPRVTLSRMPSFVQLIASIRPILRLQWAELTIVLCNKATADSLAVQGTDKDIIDEVSDVCRSLAIYTARETGIRLDIKFATSVCKTLFRALADSGYDSAQNLRGTNPLVINYSNAQEESDGLFWQLSRHALCRIHLEL
jgi:hypothetical protein